MSPNSDSEQCTESKLSRVHSTPTLGPASAHTARAQHRVTGLTRPCLRPGPVASQAWLGRVATHARSCGSTRPVMLQRTPSRVARCAMRRVAAPPARAVTRRVAASLAVSCAQQAVSWPCPRPYRSLSRDTTQRPSHPPVTIRPFVLRHNPPAARPSSARRLPYLRAGRVAGQVLGRIVAQSGRVLVVSWA